MMQTSYDDHECEPSALANWLAKQEPATFATSLNVRIGLGIYGIVLPIIFLGIAAFADLSAEKWQSGMWADKLTYALSSQCGWPVFPFLAFAMVCMGMVIRNETSAFSKAWVRFGIFSGTLVCGWYLFVFSVTAIGNPFSLFFLLIAAVVWFIFVHGFVSLLQSISKLHDLLPLITTISVIAILVLAIAVTGSPEGVLIVLFLPCVLLFLLATPLAFVSYLGISIRILKLREPSRRFTLLQLMGWVTWFSAFASALRMTIKRSLVEYSQLPLVAPYQDCYVATAASKGHPSIVGSQSLSTTDQPMVVNQQLAIFKAAELTLRAVSPQAHRVSNYL